MPDSQTPEEPKGQPDQNPPAEAERTSARAIDPDALMVDPSEHSHMPLPGSEPRGAHAPQRQQGPGEGEPLDPVARFRANLEQQGLHTPEEIDALVQQRFQQEETTAPGERVEGLTLDAASKLRVQLEAEGLLNQEQIAEIIEHQGLMLKVASGKALTEEEDETMRRISSKIEHSPEQREAINNALRRAMAEEMQPPSENAPDDISALLNDDGGDSDEATKEALAAQKAKEKSMRELNEAMQAALDDPLDKDKMKRAADLLDENRKHHEDDDEHGADYLAKTDPSWAKWLKGLGIAFYILVACQWAAAAALDAYGNQGKSR